MWALGLSEPIIKWQLNDACCVFSRSEIDWLRQKSARFSRVRLVSTRFNFIQHPTALINFGSLMKLLGKSGVVSDLFGICRTRIQSITTG